VQSEVKELRLVSVRDSEMSLMTSALIDREQTPTLRLMIVCQDAGQPVLEAVRPLVIVVDDVNDNAPRFTQSVYNVTLVENQHAPVVRLITRLSTFYLSHCCNSIWDRL